MNQIDFLDKRKHVREYHKAVPEKELIETVLWKAWKVTPSKNNFMPYNVYVLGPDKKDEKESIWRKCCSNKKKTNEKETPGHIEDGVNPNFATVKNNPYLLVISQTVRPPNEYYRRMIAEFDEFFEPMHVRCIDEVSNGTSLEIGMFSANLSAFCTEEGLDISYTCAIPNDLADWKDMAFIEHKPLLLITIGYCKVSLQDSYAKNGLGQYDKKPEFNEVVHWAD